MVVSRPVAGARPAELYRVESDPVGASAAGLAGVGPAGRAGEFGDEPLAVPACPFGDDVGDDAAVVTGGELGHPAGGADRVRSSSWA
jgi:hypothetical protein